MKKAYRTQYGTPEVLSIKETEIPQPEANELLIRVHATTVNRTDLGVLTGKPFVIQFFTGLRKPRQKTTGTDFAGVVVATGEKVSGFGVGDRVYGFQDNGLGSHAQYVCVSTRHPVYTIPEGISFEEAVSSAEAAHYAYHFMKRSGVKPGQKVMVNGGTGAIGSALIQLLRDIDCTITAVCRGEHFERVKALGPDRLIDYTKEDFTQDSETYDFVFDAVGKSNFVACKRIMRDGAAYLSSELGPGSENIYLPLITRLRGGKKVIFPIPLGIQESLQYIRRLQMQGKFKPLIDRSYPLEDIREAFEYVASGQKIGNVLLRME